MMCALWPPKTFRWLAVLWLCWALLAAALVQAEEPARDFLAGLRSRGYYDLALEYLERMQNSPLAPSAFKDVILYEKATTLIEASRYQADVELRKKQLDEAQQALKQFAGTHKDHPLAFSASNQLANLLVERGRLLVQQAGGKGLAQAEKNRLLVDARKLLDEAYQTFEKSRQELASRLKKIKPHLDPTNPQDKKLIPVRDQYQSDYLQTRLLLPRILEEKADTYPENSPERKKLLEQAAAGYKSAYDDYRTRIAGLYAKMNLGRCYVKLKDYDEALSYFGDLLDQPNQPEAFRILKQRTLVLAVDCWFAPDRKKPLYNDAILRISQMIDSLRSDEARQPEWLYLRLALAKAYKAFADDATSAREKASALTKARNHASFVAGVQSQYRQEARDLLGELRGKELPPDQQRQPETFAEARAAGKEALDQWQEAQTQIAQLKQQIKAAKNAAQKKQLQKQLQAAQQQAKESSARSLENFRLALKLADADTRLDDLNIVRYFLAFWHYTLGDMYDAALIGEFVARRYPDAPGASQCAQIALASYLQLYKENRSEDRTFETQRILSIGDWIIDTWPERSEAVVAANTLIAFMINDNKPNKALEYLQRIPTDSPQRGAAELSTGQALWSAYLRGMNRLNSEEAPQGPERQQELQRLEQMKNQAKKILSDGIQRMRAKPPNDTLLTAALSLAQIYVDTGQAGQAVKLLEDKQVGPLTLIAKKHPAAGREGFAVETYKTALRAYIASLKPGTADQRTIEKAKGIMAALRKEMGDTPEGRKNLVTIYIKLATEIKQQLEITPAAEKATLAAGFASFLREVRRGADQLSIHIWAADSFSKLGDNFRRGNTLAPEAKEFYGEAIQGFQEILERGKKQPEWLPAEVRIQVMMQLAHTQRQMGNFKEAIDTYETILQEKPSMLNVQIEAATTYQQWGEAAKSDKYYAAAMQGDRKDQRKQVDGKPNPNYLRNIIWGWGKLSQITARYPQYRDIFHQARLNLARCRLAYARLKSSAADQRKWKEAAKKDITLTQRLYPELGGAKWKPKYDKLMREIQQSLGEPVIGLRELASAAPVNKP